MKPCITCCPKAWWDGNVILHYPPHLKCGVAQLAGRRLALRPKRNRGRGIQLINVFVQQRTNTHTHTQRQTLQTANTLQPALHTSACTHLSARSNMAPPVGWLWHGGGAGGTCVQILVYNISVQLVLFCLSSPQLIGSVCCHGGEEGVVLEFFLCLSLTFSLSPFISPSHYPCLRQWKRSQSSHQTSLFFVVL